MELSPFCANLQNWILKERAGHNLEKDYEDIMVMCLRRIIDLENQLDASHAKIRFLTRKPLNKITS